MGNNRELTIHVITATCSVLSLVGCFYIISSSIRIIKAGKFDFNKQMVFVLAVSDFLNSIAFSIGPAALDISQTACQVQAAFINFFTVSGIFWNCCMAFNLYRWVVCRDDMAKLRSRFYYYIVITLTPPGCFTIFELSTNKYGKLGQWCWITSKTWQFVGSYIWVLLSGIFISVALFLVKRDIIRRFATHQNVDALNSSSLVINNLVYYNLSFVILWFPCFLNRLISWTYKDVYFLNVIQAFCLPLQGFANFIIYGGFISYFKLKWCSKDKYSRFSFSKSYSRDMNNKTSHMSKSSRSKYDIYGRQFGGSIFATTFNMGEKEVPDDLATWIQRGHDVYVIAVQECMVLTELRARILQYLQNRMRKAFTQYCREIGSNTTALGYHGYIALLIYVPTEDVENGCFYMPTNAQQKVKRGKSLPIGRASNKGAVGLAFRYFNSSYACVSCHFASNSKGKSCLKKRNQDALDIIQELRLDVDNSTGLDFSIMHHHSIILGDLNYRLSQNNATSEEILQLLLTAMKQKRLNAKMSENIIDIINSKGLQHDNENENEFTLMESPSAKSKRDAEKSRDQSMKKEASIWSDLLSHDELLHAIKNNEIFSGFEESCISFPPSYRRVIEEPFTVFEELDFHKLMNKYSIKVSGEGDRIPSYTDRIIYHSLPDMKKYLSCREYKTCERVTNSDHRPVSCVFDILLDDDMDWDLDDYDMDAHVQMKDVCGVLNCYVQLTDVKVNFLTSANSDLIESYSQKKGGSKKKELSVVAIFPLPSEDIFSDHRKVYNLASNMVSGFTNMSLLDNESNECTVSYDQFVNMGLGMQTTTRPRNNMHLALKIECDAVNFGQCIVCVHEAYTQLDTNVQFSTPVTIAGKKVGELTGNVLMKLTCENEFGMIV